MRNCMHNSPFLKHRALSWDQLHLRAVRGFRIHPGREIRRAIPRKDHVTRSEPWRQWDQAGDEDQEQDQTPLLIRAPPANFIHRRGHNHPGVSSVPEHKARALLQCVERAQDKLLLSGLSTSDGARPLGIFFLGDKSLAAPKR